MCWACCIQLICLVNHSPPTQSSRSGIVSRRCGGQMVGRAEAKSDGGVTVHQVGDVPRSLKVRGDPC